MAAIWPGSRVPGYGVGDKLYFYDAETTTPQVVYSDGALSVARNQPILADARGMFPTPGRYRQKLTGANDALIFDDDDIDVAQAASYVPPDPGETDPTLLFTTGNRIGHYGTTAPAGWVRCNGRGASAAGDWAANKTIALPDYRDRVAIGLGGMGNSDINLIPDGTVDGGEANTTLGATVGAATQTLTTAQIPAHLHAKGTLKMPNHGHPTRTTSRNDSGPFQKTAGGFMLTDLGNGDYAAWTGTAGDTAGRQIGGSGEVDIVGSTANTGDGGSHPNVQPSLFELVIIKL